MSRVEAAFKFCHSRNEPKPTHMFGELRGFIIAWAKLIKISGFFQITAKALQRT